MKGGFFAPTCIPACRRADCLFPSPPPFEDPTSTLAPQTAPPPLRSRPQPPRLAHERTNRFAFETQEPRTHAESHDTDLSPTFPETRPDTMSVRRGPPTQVVLLTAASLCHGSAHLQYKSCSEVALCSPWSPGRYSEPRSSNFAHFFHSRGKSVR